MKSLITTIGDGIQCTVIYKVEDSLHRIIILTVNVRGKDIYDDLNYDCILNIMARCAKENQK